MAALMAAYAALSWLPPARRESDRDNTPSRWMMHDCVRRATLRSSRPTLAHIERSDGGEGDLSAVDHRVIERWLRGGAALKKCGSP
eukprot:1163037-Pyramimonas_sp.AAC.1